MLFAVPGGAAKSSTTQFHPQESYMAMNGTLKRAKSAALFMGRLWELWISPTKSDSASAAKVYHSISFIPLIHDFHQ
jgi:hypothetical protein